VCIGLKNTLSGLCILLDFENLPRIQLSRVIRKEEIQEYHTQGRKEEFLITGITGHPDPRWIFISEVHKIHLIGLSVAHYSILPVYETKLKIQSLHKLDSSICTADLALVAAEEMATSEHIDIYFYLILLNLISTSSYELKEVLKLRIDESFRRRMIFEWRGESSLMQRKTGEVVCLIGNTGNIHQYRVPGSLASLKMPLPTGTGTFRTFAKISPEPETGFERVAVCASSPSSISIFMFAGDRLKHAAHFLVDFDPWRIFWLPPLSVLLASNIFGKIKQIPVAGPFSQNEKSSVLELDEKQIKIESWFWLPDSFFWKRRLGSILLFDSISESIRFYDFPENEEKEIRTQRMFI